ncbi:carbohydrate kinase family protein [Piscinibacter sakaiensis]|uniref:Sugar kinases, ribokinase family n=1 Tax=Piscinibacter sakaiensis TaxID=1547922 RepID=A0A0K8NY11_PISS1|nr:carbohydrate kinase family protein [Piscinibacter sakaiensis]GAP35263.1 sugar kinases, ribokinase family [Piscinibacter sakaiensis]
MPALICGSLAFDTITTFPGRFAQQILPDQVHILNVSFLVPTLRREFGGCAGNIAYNLAGLGGSAVVMAAVGNDGGEYVERLGGLGVDTRHIAVAGDSYTAQAIIITDTDNNQITAFHPGAMQSAHETPVPARADLKIAIIAPDGREAMLQHARQLAEARIPFIFDPGQGLPMFDGDELRAFLAQATWAAMNDYEARMLCERTGETLASLSRGGLQGVVVTLGAEGCEVWIQGERTHVPGVTATEVADPTGCGDAFRAALLYGLERGWTLARCAELGNRLGALKIAQRGGQNHTIDRAALGL